MYSRVSSSAMYRSVLGTLQNNLSNYQNLIRQQTTLQKYASLSENPSAVSRALELESEIQANEQYQANSKVAVSMLKYSEGAMTSILDAAQSIRDLVVQAGDGTLSPDELDDIAQKIEANRNVIVDALNTKVAGQYIFGGTNTSDKPFTVNADGTITYHGTDSGLAYALSETLNGVVSFTGSEILSRSDDTFFICSHEVGTDWTWTGREEKVQITVGNRTIAIYIPENWIDEITTAQTKPTDYNRYRDPDEVTGISLDDLATLINRSLQEQGADMLVNAYVQKNGNTQQLFIKSLSGEEIGVTGWTDTDYLPMAQSLAGLQFEKTGTTAGGDLEVKLPDWNSNQLSGSVDVQITGLKDTQLDIYVDSNKIEAKFTADPADTDALLKAINDELEAKLGDKDVTASLVDGKLMLTSATGKSLRVDGGSSAAALVFGETARSAATSTNGLMGAVNLMNWRDDGFNKGIKIDVGGSGSLDIEFGGLKTITDLVEFINSTAIANNVDCTASVTAGRLVLQSEAGPITVTDMAGLTTGGTNQLFGCGDTLTSSTSALTIQVGTNPNIATVIYINEKDTLDDIADKINAIEGVYARTSADGDQLVVVAQRIGPPVGNYLSTDAAQEAEHYPQLTIRATGMALQLFDFDVTTDELTGQQTGSVTSEFVTRAVDHSHMDVFAVLGMETALKSVEMELGDTLKVNAGTTLHWRVMSGDRTAEISLAEGEYSLTDIADRINSAAGAWLDVVVDVSNPGSVNSDQTEYDDFNTSYNSEAMTQRLVIRGLNGQEVILVDVNEQHYADELGLSTALRSGTDFGLKDIAFPDAACVDDNIGVQMRVQMNCGMTYDISIKKADVVDADSGLVNRTKVMEQIVKQVNAQEGKPIMGITYPKNEAMNGDNTKDMASIYFLSGEPFTVVDLPFNDPLWTSYSGGLAAQLGIHGGVTANLAAVSFEYQEDDGTGTLVTKTGKMKDLNKFGDFGIAPGTIKFESLGHSVEIDVLPTDKIKDVMDRLRSQAGDWLYVNYFDAHMGSGDSRNGDYPVIAISAKDGSAVGITDMKGSIAQDVLGISTGILGEVDVTSDKFAYKDWKSGQTPGMVFEITVAGYTHAIDMTAMLDTNGNEKMDCYDLVATINARMQDYDITAEINEDGCLVLSSLRGYSFDARVYEVDNNGVDTGNDLTSMFFGRTRELAGTTDVSNLDWTNGISDFVDNNWTNGTTPSSSDIDDMIFELNVTGKKLKIDMAGITDADGDSKLTCADLVAAINTAINADPNMKDYGITAKVSSDDNGKEYLVLSSSLGYSFSTDIYFVDNAGNRIKVDADDGTGTNIPIDLNATFFGNTTLDESSSVTTYYRGGYRLDDDASTRQANGIYTQNTTIRSGSNTTTQTAYELFGDITNAVRAGNRDALSEKMLPRIDEFINNILSILSTNGALQNRYESNKDRLITNQTILSEEQQDLVGINLAEIATAIAEANYAYQANLYALSSLMNMPTLLNFLS